MTHHKQTFVLATILMLFICCNESRKENSSETEKIHQTCDCFIDRISTDDTLKINYETAGCFHRMSEILKIYRNGKELVAALIGSSRHSTILKLTASLNESSIILYENFEKNGKTYKSEYTCTTNERFSISLKTDSIKFEQNGCDFESYEKLKVNIFGRAELEEYNKKIYL